MAKEYVPINQNVNTQINTGRNTRQMRYNLKLDMLQHTADITQA